MELKNDKCQLSSPTESHQCVICLHIGRVDSQNNGDQTLKVK